MKNNQNLKIFIVEDNDYYNELLKKRLEKHSSNLFSFKEGASVLKQLFVNPDIIILDHNLEDTNGIDLLKEIKGYDPDIHVVFLTGQEKLNVVVEAMKYGAFDYIEKNDETFDKLDKVITRINKLADLFVNRQKKNKRKLSRLFKRIPLLYGLLILFSSCSTNRILEVDKLKTQLNQDSTFVSSLIQEKYKIRPDDKLTLSIWGHDELSVGSTFGIYNSNEIYGKWILVNEAGMATFPAVGEVKIGNLTLDQATKTLSNLYSKEIVNPILILRILNKQITILGEVKTPGVYSIDKENNNLFELLGKAGGANYYANLRKITILRGDKNKPETFLVDLKKVAHLGEMTIQLKPDDVVYLPPLYKQRFDKDIGVMVGIGSILTSLALLFSGILN